MSDVFHLNLTKAQLKGATLAIVPGDPARSERIAKKLDNPEFLASTREFTSWLGYLNGQPVVVCSTGIGGPSTSICVEELAQLGVRTFYVLAQQVRFNRILMWAIFLLQRVQFVLMVQAVTLRQLNIQQWQILNVPRHFSMRLKKKALSHL